MTTFSSLCSIGTITRSVPPHSSRRNAVIGPTAARSLRLRFAPTPRGLVQSCYPRGRRGGFAAHGAVAPGLCCGPRYAASGARKRAPADHVSRSSRRGPPQQRHADCGFPAEDASCGTANPKSEIRNPNFLSRSSRRGPPQQRHADSRLRVEGASRERVKGN